MNKGELLVSNNLKVQSLELVGDQSNMICDTLEGNSFLTNNIVT